MFRCLQVPVRLLEFGENSYRPEPGRRFEIEHSGNLSDTERNFGQLYSLRSRKGMLSVSYTRMIATVSLDKFHVEEAGFTSGPYIFEFDLVLPRPSVNDVSRPIVVDEFADGPRDWSDRPFRERILFKEIVEGPLSLGLAVYPAEDPFLEQLTGVIQSLGTELASQYLNFRVSTLRSMIGLAQEEGVANPEKKLEKSVATGTVQVDPDSVSERTMEVPLEAASRLKNPSPDTDSDVPERLRDDVHDEVLKEPGDPNGYVELTVELVER